MKTLHIFRSEPDEMTKMFVREISVAGGSEEVLLYQGDVDYDELVKKIFESDQIISWW